MNKLHIVKFAFALSIIGVTSLFITFLWQKRINSNRPSPASQIRMEQASSKNVSLPFYSTIGDKTATVATQEKAEQYTLEVKRFTRQRQAEAYIDSLAQKKINAYFTPVMSDGQVYYLVRVGVFPTKEAAESHAKQFKVAQKLESKIIRLQ